MPTRKLLSAVTVALAVAVLAPSADACHRRRCQRRAVPCAAPAVYAAARRPVYAAPQGVAQAQPGATDVHGFCAWLNQFRARHGRGPVAVDGQLCHDAAVNSSMGFGHSHMGSARRQNAAVGSIASAQSGWVASPAHLDALLDPSITAIGLGQVGQVVTFSAR